MPYIPDVNNVREALSKGECKPTKSGELNYLITKLCHDFVQAQGVSYCTFDIVVGALECAKLEFYRAVVGPYESQKKSENGPVSELDGVN